jgi:hypothetical protein
MINHKLKVNKIVIKTVAAQVNKVVILAINHNKCN